MFHDLLGIYDGHAARFVKRYASVREEMIQGVAAFAEEVRQRRYPGPEHGYTMAPDEVSGCTSWCEAGGRAVHGRLLPSEPA